MAQNKTLKRNTKKASRALVEVKLGDILETLAPEMGKKKVKKKVKKAAKILTKGIKVNKRVKTVKTDVQKKLTTNE